MGPALSTAPLTRDRVVQAFPLIREIAPNLSVEGWVDFAGRLISKRGDADGRGGIIIAERNRYIRGLFTYEVSSDLCHGRILFAHNVVALDLVQREAVAEVLADAMNRLGQVRECDAVHVHLPPLSAWALPCFERHGHQVEGHHLCFRIGAHRADRRRGEGASAGRTVRLVR